MPAVPPILADQLHLLQRNVQGNNGQPCGPGIACAVGTCVSTGSGSICLCQALRDPMWHAVTRTFAWQMRPASGCQSHKGDSLWQYAGCSTDGSKAYTAGPVMERRCTQTTTLMQPLRLLGYHREVCDVMHVECRGVAAITSALRAGRTWHRGRTARPMAPPARRTTNARPDTTVLARERDQQGLLRGCGAPALPHVEPILCS